jgi:hypothetical protein
MNTSGPCSTALAAYYAPYFVNPDVSDVDFDSLTPGEIFDVISTRFGAKLNGLLKNADGTYNGAFFPDGTWNDGTVYGATPATSISASAQLSTVTVGQPVTITYQLDAAAVAAVTITPAKSGVSGSFSPSTVVIATGDSSGSTTFTPTTAGTASLTCTNNRSLANPAAIVLPVTAAQVGPTVYTQALNVGAHAPLLRAITISYTLDAAAITPVTITPACTLAGTFTSGSTVVVPFGATAAQATFVPSVAGTATFSATNDSGLTNPATVQTSVTNCSNGQLVVLGIRKAH